jgi:hypothetical protein
MSAFCMLKALIVRILERLSSIIPLVLLCTFSISFVSFILKWVRSSTAKMVMVASPIMISVSFHEKMNAKVKAVTTVDTDRRMMNR